MCTYIKNNTRNLQIFHNTKSHRMGSECRQNNFGLVILWLYLYRLKYSYRNNNLSKYLLTILQFAIYLILMLNKIVSDKFISVSTKVLNEYLKHKIKAICKLGLDLV